MSFHADRGMSEARVQSSGCKPGSARVWISTGAMMALLVLLWAFPSFWYTQTDPKVGQFWWLEQTNITGWLCQTLPVDKAAEAALVADQLYNGEFRRADGRVVRVFSARRYAESGDEVGLFVHTPDRCWTAAGWTLEPAEPQYRWITAHGTSMLFERRLFSHGTQHELVYFGGFVGGQPLPFRLDHNIPATAGWAGDLASGRSGSKWHASHRLWSGIWRAFTSRRPLVGPKQLVRISTPTGPGHIEDADALLESFLPQWLLPVPYQQSIQQWRGRISSK